VETETLVTPDYLASAAELDSLISEAVARVTEPEGAERD
jgi:hypothetical protein